MGRALRDLIVRQDRGRVRLATADGSFDILGTDASSRLIDMYYVFLGGKTFLGLFVGSSERRVVGRGAADSGRRDSGDILLLAFETDFFARRS